MTFRLAIAAAIVVAICGCSDPKTANDKNFKNAIQVYLDTAYPRCYVHANFPRTIAFDYRGETRELRALARAGLLVEYEGTVEAPAMFGSARKQSATAFDLT